MGIQEQGDGGSLHSLPEGAQHGSGQLRARSLRGGAGQPGMCVHTHRHSAKLSGTPGPLAVFPKAEPTPSTSPQLCGGHSAGHAAPRWQRGRSAVCGAGRRLGVTQDLHWA